jgi:hypothetical protein
MELLDPVVILFLESLAEEIYKVAGEISNLENRLLDKISSLLVPNTEAIAQPAHTLLHVSPQETSLEVTTTTGFYHLSGHNKEPLFFYPVCNTKIHKGDVCYFIHNGTIYAVNKDQTRTRLTRNGKSKPQTENTFWTGLELDEGIDNLSNLSFYLNFQGIPQKEKYLNLLSCTTWKIQDQTIPMSKGLFFTGEKYGDESLEFFASCDLSHRINDSIKKEYDNRFLTVTGNFDIKDKRSLFPQELTDCFSTAVMSGFNKPLLWIEVACPQDFTAEILDNLQVAVNVIPAVNKRLVSKSTVIKPELPFIPLNTNPDESFISVRSLSDSEGKSYYDMPVNKIPCGMYSLRRGSCERYKTRDAQEYLASLINLLDGKIAGFFKEENDVRSDLKMIEAEARELIKQLTQVIADTKERQEVENYICIDTQKEDVFFVEYWMTNGSGANHIPAGTTLSVDNLQVKPDSVVILSATQGGKPAPLAMDRNSFYKKSLSENKLLVTHEDIKNFCIKNFKAYFSDIQVRKGWMESKNPRTGFVRTTDVYMNPRTELKKQMRGQEANFFEQILKENSPATFNYRVFIGS